MSRPAHVRAIAKAGADGVIVASALVDALGPDGRDVDGLARLVGELRAATKMTTGQGLAMSTFDEKARDWDTPERQARAEEIADASATPSR